MLFQEAPANTSFYMYLGYGVFSTVGLIYVLSLYVRTRRLNAELRSLEEVQNEQTSRRKK